MSRPDGTITRLLQLSVERLPEDELRAAVETLADRLFRATPGSDSVYRKMTLFARMFCGGWGDEGQVADVITRVLVELFPAGRLEARNSRQLEGLLRTAIRNRIVDVRRRDRRQVPLETEPESRGHESLDETAEMLAAFCAHLERDLDAPDRAQRATLARLLIESEGATTKERRQAIMDRLELKNATYYRRRDELAAALLEFLEEAG